MGNRDALRSLTVSRAKESNVATVEIDGHEFGIKRASIADIEAIEDGAGVKFGAGASGFRENLAFTLHAIVRCVVDDDGKEVFDKTDLPALRSQPYDGWLKELGEAVATHAFGQPRDKSGNDSSESPETSSHSPSASGSAA